MKKLILFFTLSLTVLQLSAQKDKVSKEHKAGKKAPPGTLWLKDSIYIDQTEIRNLDYVEFLYWTARNEPEKLKSIQPDTSVWFDVGNFALSDYYLRHQAYRSYPVVGITYEQAVAFCNWRTYIVKEFIKIKKSTIEKMIGGRDFYYRLPTKEEWEYAASAGLSANYSYGFKSIINKDHFPNINVAETRILYTENSGDFLDPVYSRYPNDFRLYCMIGNVAEMISEKGIAKGGSYKQTLEESAITNSITYNKPTAFIGFRCVCVVVK
ncbi:MAG TPA: SUMF1/EgtB/PvdO family nonheme iron enzyme [Bacteroidia bacterium]|jgi:formylglycine-generating enzyme required for sulfatase activity|nr:SUMF1/EgtB/PvdO family nonheme iron enzyme [Bacteroidia bacterium]